MVNPRTISALFFGLALGACTLIVDQELSKHPPQQAGSDAGDAGDAGPDAGGDAGPDAGPDAGEDAGPDAGEDAGEDAGPDASCPEAPFLDGTYADGGGPVIHADVSAVRWHGPSFPPPGGADSTPHRGSIVFLVDGGLGLGAGVADDVYVRFEENDRPALVVGGGAHVGPLNYGCVETLGGQYDALHGVTSWDLVPLGGCGGDAVDWDGGSTSGAPETQLPAVGVAPAPDGGAFVAMVLGGAAQRCDEVDPFPLACWPPSGPGAVSSSSFFSIDGLLGSDGNPVWAVSGPSAVQLYPADFGAPGGLVVSGQTAPSVTPVATDVALAASIGSGHLLLTLFGIDAHIVATADIDLGDTGASGLHVAHFDGSGATAKAAWIGGDGQARVATIDFTAPAAMTLSAPQVVCQSAGATLAAPMTPAQTVVQVSDGLYLRLY